MMRTLTLEPVEEGTEVDGMADVERGGVRYHGRAVDV